MDQEQLLQNLINGETYLLKFDDGDLTIENKGDFGYGAISTRIGLRYADKLVNMEDTHITGYINVGEYKYQVAIVFDGHCGYECAFKAKDNFLSCLQHTFNKLQCLTEKVLVSEAICEACKIFNELFFKDNETSGCTMSGVIFSYYLHGFNIHFNLGDSLSMVVSNLKEEPSFITNYHKATNLDEKKRVIELGALIKGNYMINPETNEGIAVTRSLGDKSWINYMSNIPEITFVNVTDEHIAVLILSDGAPDEIAMSFGTEAKKMRLNGDPGKIQDIAEKLAIKSIHQIVKKWYNAFGPTLEAAQGAVQEISLNAVKFEVNNRKLIDNITVIIRWLS
jgi:serine/threonine protein phosphatase PrpC